MSKLPQQIVEGLKTKSDKIRALDAAGFSRVEIAAFLKIRYQHVRNVLVQNSTDRKPAPKQEEVDSELWPIERLLDAGFERIGDCEAAGENAFAYTATAAAGPGVYAFAVDGFVHYVGLTRGQLRTRLGHYVYGHERQRTSARIKKLILEALGAGKAVCVLTAQPPSLEWNGLPVDGPAGLETGLIRLIRPPWNQHGAA